jgi:hypothetical protein
MTDTLVRRQRCSTEVDKNI